MGLAPTKHLIESQGRRLLTGQQHKNLVGMIGIAPTRISPQVFETCAAALTPHAHNQYHCISNGRIL